MSYPTGVAIRIEEKVGRTHTFVTLDALRGVAALVVIVFHFNRLFGGTVFPHGYLAVDFFFMLSGFVLSFAYQQRLDQGWSTLAFLKARMIRLYPLYLLALGAGVAFKLAADHFGKTRVEPYSAGGMAVLLALGLLLLPALSPGLPGNPLTFPFNYPAWSLFFEVLANVVHALVLRRRSLRVLGVAMLLSGVSFAVFALRSGGVDFGPKRSELLYGVARVLFSYLVGMLLYRLWQSGRFRLRLSPLVPAVALTAVLAIGSFGGAVLDLCLIGLALPLILMIGATSTEPAALRGISRSLGTTSYAIYVFHVTIVLLFEHLWISLRHRSLLADEPWGGLGAIACTYAFAVAIDRVFDIPVRKLLRGRPAAPRPVAGVAS